MRNIRRFYLAFEKRDTLSPELSWSHCNVLTRVENASAKLWYQQELLKERERVQQQLSAKTKIQADNE